MSYACHYEKEEDKNGLLANFFSPPRMLEGTFEGITVKVAGKHTMQ